MYFPSTRWTLLAQATLSGETAGRAALNELCRRYWQPLARYIQMRGYSDMEAQDLTQEFILHLLEHSTLSRADRERGKFRSFLLGALTHFLHDARDKRLAQKRGGTIQHESIDEAQASAPLAAECDATAFDREWALAILASALRDLNAEMATSGGSARIQVLQRFLPGSVELLSYEDAAAQLGLSIPALKSEVHRARNRFRALVRQQIVATVGAPHEVDAEMEYLGRVLMDRGSALQQKPLQRAS